MTKARRNVILCSLQHQGTNNNQNKSEICWHLYMYCFVSVSWQMCKFNFWCITFWKAPHCGLWLWKMQASRGVTGHRPISFTTIEYRTPALEVSCSMQSSVLYHLLLTRSNSNLSNLYVPGMRVCTAWARRGESISSQAAKTERAPKLHSKFNSSQWTSDIETLV